MASIANSVSSYETSDYTGKWEDVQQYTSVTVTVQSSESNTLTLQWDNPKNGIPAVESPLLNMDISITEHPQTVNVDHRGRWFRVKINNTVACSISTVHKHIPSTIKIRGGSSNADAGSSGSGTVNINKSLNVIFTDMSCAPLATTETHTHTHTPGSESSALYTTLMAKNGQPIANYMGSTSIIMRSEGVNIPSLCSLHSESHNSLLCCPYINYPQAGTTDVSGSYTQGKALYIATPSSSTTSVPNMGTANSLAVCLTNSHGLQQNAFYVSSINVLPTLLSFDVGHGMNTTLTSCVSEPCTLYDLYCYNDGPVIAWIMLYDTDDVNSTAPPILTIPVLRNDFHDIVFPKGCAFSNGICIRGSTNQDYADLVSPGPNVLFVSGTYYVQP